MDRECNIVRDLMILYELENCSDESVQMIKEHIEECEECRKIWESKTGEVLEKTVNEVMQDDGKEEFDKLRKRIRRRNFLKIIAIAIVLSVGTYKGYWFIKGPVTCEIEDMEFSNFHKADGAIGFKVTLTDGKGFDAGEGYFAGSFEEDSVEVAIYRSRFPKKTTEESEMSMYVNVPGLDGGVKEIYYKNGDEYVLIWQEGDPISELTDEIQADMDKIQSNINN